MGRDKCRACRKSILLLACRDGRTRSFDPATVSLAEDPFRSGFVLMGTRHAGQTITVTAVPVRDVADRKLDGYRTQVFALHFCPEWAEQQMRLTRGDITAALFGESSRPG